MRLGAVDGWLSTATQHGLYGEPFSAHCVLTPVVTTGASLVMPTSMCRGSALAIVATLLAAAPVAADIVQVTNLPPTQFVGNPSISGDGRFLTFLSSGDLGGLNPTGIPNIFVYDGTTGKFTRVTTNGGADPTISGDGRFIAFSSSADYARRNADGSDEIYRYDRVGKHFVQLTRDNNGDGQSELPVINRDGRRVVFETTSDVRRRNPDFSPEVGLFYGSAVPMSVDPNGDGESHSPAISADGSFAVFQTTSNLAGRNEDLSQELMLYDVKMKALTQVTNDPDGTGSSGTAAISGDASAVVFISSSNVAGLNPDNFNAVYLLSRRHTFSVITTTPDGLFDGDTPTVNDDGRWIAFVSGFNLTGGNPDFNSEILLYDRLRKTFAQVTDSTGCFNGIRSSAVTARASPSSPTATMPAPMPTRARRCSSPTTRRCIWSSSPKDLSGWA